MACHGHMAVRGPVCRRRFSSPDRRNASQVSMSQQQLVLVHPEMDEATVLPFGAPGPPPFRFGGCRVEDRSPEEDGIGALAMFNWVSLSMFWSVCLKRWPERCAQVYLSFDCRSSDPSPWCSDEMPEDGTIFSDPGLIIQMKLCAAGPPHIVLVS